MRALTRGRRALGRGLSALAAGLLLAGLAPSFAATVSDDRGVALSFEQPPQRVISLLPSLTETVCELGACERLVGVDRFSNWPASVQALPRLGGLEDALVERIYALRPDVVLAARSARVTDRLEALGLKVIALQSDRLADLRRSVHVIARMLDRPDAGDALLARIDARLRQAAARVPARWRGARVYFEVASTPYAAGESSYIGELLTLMGLANLVPAAMGPFPKLNPEFVVRGKPDLIMAADRNLADMAQRPGWKAIAALAAGHSCGFDLAQNDLLVRPGPRLAEAAEVLADCLARLPDRRSGAP
jgi:iron complex transport system substrate-binding protein